MRKTTVIILATLLVVPAIAATRTVDETRPAAPDGVIEIQVLAGSISVSGWERAELNVTGTIDDEEVEFEIKNSGKRTSISVEPLGRSLDKLSGTMELEIRVPRGSRIEAESLSAGFAVEAINGAVTIESISGAVEISGAVPKIEVSTINGLITISPSAELLSGDCQSVSGNIRLKAMLSPDGNFSFETVSGNIELRLPSGTSAEFNVETFNGDIQNDFGPAAEKTSPYLPSKSLEFSIGGGGASVSVSSINGNVQLVRD
jgi:DUF4097 and DUF4098 domain-containing protein YvlB